MYANISTVLKIGSRRHDPIQCGRGVHQGDTLSAILFNCVMDEVLVALNPAIGYFVSKDLVAQCMTFADDLSFGILGISYSLLRHRSPTIRLP